MLQPDATSPPTVLCIEDERILREFIRDGLTEFGFRVLTAGTGAEAGDLVFSERPDIVLCDVMLPDINGFELLKALKRDGRLDTHTPFIFLTALSDRAPQIEGLLAGASDYIAKPVDLDLLQLKITNILALTQPAEATAGEEAFVPGVHMSPREQQVLAMLGEGDRTAMIAYRLGLSEHTVNQYIRDLYRKLGISNRAEAVRIALGRKPATPPRR